MNYYHIIFGENVPFNILDYKSIMFNHDFYNSIKQETCETTNETINENINENVVDEKSTNKVSDNITSYTPDKKDSLFWCIYIAINGFVEYELIHRNFTNVIIAEKQKVAESFSQNIKRMKNINVKLTNSNIQNIISIQKKQITNQVEINKLENSINNLSNVRDKNIDQFLKSNTKSKFNISKITIRNIILGLLWAFVFYKLYII